LESRNNLFRYTYETKLSSKDTYLEFTVGNKTIKQHIANGYKAISSEEININGDTVVVEEGSSVSCEDNKVKIKLNGMETTDITFAPYAKISSEIYGENSFSDKENLLLKINLTNTSDEDIVIKLYFYSSSGMKRIAGEYILVKGRETQITIKLDTIGWKYYDSIKHLMFECQNSPTVREFVINDIHLEG
jgi:hypothetical protein